MGVGGLRRSTPKPSRSGEARATQRDMWLRASSTDRPGPAIPVSLLGGAPTTSASSMLKLPGPLACRATSFQMTASTSPMTFSQAFFMSGPIRQSAANETLRLDPPAYKTEAE